MMNQSVGSSPQAVTNNRTPCPVCGSSQMIPLFTRNAYTLVKCQTCDLVHVNPMPTDDAIRAHYQEPEYYQGNEAQGYLDYADMRKALQPYFQRRLDTLARHFKPGGHLLDFGCAAGYFLEMAHSRGWRIAGVELSQDMAATASKQLGIVVANSLNDVSKHDFDVITLWEVVEHLPRPVSELSHLYQFIRPGGALMLSTPNTNHWQAVREPDQWESFRPPAHLMYFTPATLRNVLQRAGFERIGITRVSPLPPLPALLRDLSRPLHRSLANGQARRWRLALYTWRAIRVLGWGWSKVAHRSDDIFTTLEAIAFKPS